MAVSGTARTVSRTNRAARPMASMLRRVAPPIRDTNDTRSTRVMIGGPLGSHRAWFNNEWLTGNEPCAEHQSGTAREREGDQPGARPFLKVARPKYEREGEFEQCVRE